MSVVETTRVPRTTGSDSECLSMGSFLPRGQCLGEGEVRLDTWGPGPLGGPSSYSIKLNLTPFDPVPSTSVLYVTGRSVGSLS